MKSHISLRRLFSHRRSDERKTIFSWTRPPQGSLGRCRGRSPCPSPRGRPSDRRSPAAARCHQPSHLHERNETMGFRKVSKRFAPTCTVVGWAMEGFGKRVAVARDRDAPMGMISPFCAARLPGPTARTLASLICGHDRGKTRKCQCGMDRGGGLGRRLVGADWAIVPWGLLRRTFDTADSGRMMPPTLFVGATIFSTRTRSRRGIRRLAILRSSVDSKEAWQSGGG